MPKASKTSSLNDVKKIFLGDRPVNTVHQTINNTDTVLWETSDVPDYLLTNISVFYANAGGNSYLSARGYSQVAIGSWASDYAYLIGDVEYSFRGRTFKLAEGVQLDVTSVGTQWLSIKTVGGRSVVVAENRGTTVGNARTGSITGASIGIEVDGVSKTITWAGTGASAKSVTQEANAIEKTVHRDPHTTDSFTITSSAFDYPTHAKAPAGDDSGVYAVITATGTRTTTRNTEYWYTSGHIDSTQTQVSTTIPLTDFRFELDWPMENPYDTANIYPYPGMLDPSETLPWEYDDGTTYGANQRVVTFNDMGTDPYQNGRAVNVYVSAVDENGSPVVFSGGNTITLYQAANTVVRTAFVSGQFSGTASLANWSQSGTADASTDGDETVLTVNMTGTRRQTYSSGAYVDTANVALSFESNLTAYVPPTQSWITVAPNDADPSTKRTVRVSSYDDDRDGYISLQTGSGQTLVVAATVFVRQRGGGEDSGDEPEPED